MHTQESLSGKSLGELVTIFNAMPGVKQVKRFADRKAGVSRILAAQSTNEKPAQPPAAPTPAPAPAKQQRRPSKAAAKAQEPAPEYKGKPLPRTTSKRGRFIERLLSAEGVSADWAKRSLGWNPKPEISDVLRQTAAKYGFKVTEKDGVWFAK